MTDFFISFGMRYRHENHPEFPIATPDGYVRITAIDEMHARYYLRERINNRYAFIYPLGDLQERRNNTAHPDWYPQGELAYWHWPDHLWSEEETQGRQSCTVDSCNEQRG